MKGNELRKLTRRQLLELLLKQTQRAEDLQLQNNTLKQQQDEKRMIVQEAGTMAEAALKLNKVFEAADAAAKQYVTQIQGYSIEDLKASKLTYNEAELQSIEMIRQAKEKCMKMEADSVKQVSKLQKDILRLYNVYYDIQDRVAKEKQKQDE